MNENEIFLCRIKIMNQTIKIVLIFLIMSIISLYLLADDNIKNENNLEDRMKAVFIFNFTKYIQWSDNDTSGTFEIAIIGSSNIIDPLKEIAKNKFINNKQIKIKNCKDIQDIITPHILFISISEKNNLDKILQKVKNKNILTISDCKGFANKGVAINFVIVKGKIKFEINTRAIESAGLQISSQLLKLAILVQEEGEQSND